ncbi:hypothetical protein ACSSS7_003288 [Eimeria intestinalis]
MPELPCRWFLPALSCRRLQYLISGTRFNYIEVERNGRSYYLRDDLHRFAWFHRGLLRATLARERRPPARHSSGPAPLAFPLWRTPAAPAVHCLTAADWEPLALTVPTQVSAGVVEVTNAAHTPLHLTAGWPLATTEIIHPAYFQALRIVPAPPRRRRRSTLPHTNRSTAVSFPFCPLPIAAYNLRN